MSEDILAQLEWRDHEFHARPFLSGAWGGINAYNVPIEAVSSMLDALATLAPGFTVGLRVRGKVNDALTGREYALATLTDAQYVMYGIVEVNHMPVVPVDGIWQEIELRTQKGE
jgi:hypothetical protein